MNLKDLVLLGGGHSHVTVLKQFGMKPLPGVRLTLISRDVTTPYSGMLPGLVAGHYSYDDAHIDLQPLTRFAGARAIFDEVIALDLADCQVRCRKHPPVSYDVLSINIGSTPSLEVPGAAANAMPVKPIDRLLDRWQGVRERLRARAAPARVAVVGGGAGGVELLLAVQYAMRLLFEQDGRRTDPLEYHLFTDTDTILPDHNAGVARRFRRVLGERGVIVHTRCAVVEVTPGRLRTADGSIHEADEILWTTEASAARWLAESGLAVDDSGFVRVSTRLQSISHENVFAAGDVASMVGHPRPKSGVFAVRQGRPLATNLRHTLLGRPLIDYYPQRQFLSLITTGDKYAVASRGPLACEGAWVWRWKDWIDQRFMRTYNQLPEMPGAGTPARAEGSVDHMATSAVSATAMRCGGCGAKVGADVLARALQRIAVPPATEADVFCDVVIGLEAPDDAAVIGAPVGKALIQTVDFFRAMIDDPYVFGQVAANHSLGDVYAMGGEPQSVLAIVTIPHGPQSKVEDTLTHLMAGAAEVLREAGATLVGGHTGEGAELALGFAVTGVVDRHRILRKGALRPGDRLILTKPIGTGTLFAADMQHRAKGRWIAAAVASMLQSNREAAQCLLAHDATACTDVTGFGLLGHLVEMLRASGVDAEIDLDALPILEGAEDTARVGILSSLHPQNVRLRRTLVDQSRASNSPRFALIFDPQTAGGLLAGVPSQRAETCVRELRGLGYRASVIGTVQPRGDRPECVTLRP